MLLRYTCGYTLLFGLLAFVSRYDVWLSLPPTSIHQWRQADGAAIAWHYAQNPDFSEVLICNLFQTGDAHAVGELPLLYWFSGLISYYWDWPTYPLRWVGLLLLFLGGWAFGWVILQQTRRSLPAMLGAGLLLTSPILAYYSPSFLPDAPAFCFVLMMMACLFRAEQKQSKGWLFAAGVAAILAISLKISATILPTALAATWGLGNWQRRWHSESIWSSRWPFLVIVGVCVAVLCVRWWIADYNALHHATYFLTSTRPIWRYDWPFIRETFGMIGRMGLPAYASAGLYLTCFGSLYLSLKRWKTTPFALRKIMALVALGSAVYVSLWFRMLREHDYYVLCLLAIPALLLLNGFRLAMLQYDEKRLAYALGFSLLLGIWHNHYVMTKRLHLAFHPQTSQNLPPEAFLSSRHLAEAGVPASAKVLCPQDPSPNIALLALQRHGWSAYNFGDRITADTLQKYHANFELTHLALRDTALYNPLYRQFFPIKVCEIGGWHLFAVADKGKK